MPLPQIWPVFNAINILLLNEAEPQVAPAKQPKLKIAIDGTGVSKYAWYHELINRHLRLSTYIAVALFAYCFTFPNISVQGLSQLSLSKIATYWFPIIVCRDMCITFTFYGSWHWLLYESSQASKMKSRKFNPEFPQASQWSHDRFWTLSGTLISSLYETLVLTAFVANFGSPTAYGVFCFHSDFWAVPVSSIFWMLVIPYWRDFHFYWIHRLMHPWFAKVGKGTQRGTQRDWACLDLGRFLYRHVHSLHHKSYNTGPWSGLSMHPVEHIIYYSCTLSHLVLMYYLGVPQHSMHFLFNKFHATISPLPGHDGFDSPGGGSYFHYLHHSHFQCNYGTPMVPFDKWFGTFEDGAKFRKEKKYDSAKELMKEG